jgi:transcriptional regulator with XRE-family HTH domain
MDSSAISRLENGLAPLRYRDAQKIFRRFAISPKWLATGEGKIAPIIFDARIWEKAGVEEDMLFSEAFERVGKPSMELLGWPAPDQRRRSLAKLHFPPDAVGRAWAVLTVGNVDLLYWVAEVSDARFEDLLIEIETAANAVLVRPPNDSPAVVKQRLAEIEKIIGQVRARAVSTMVANQQKSEKSSGQDVTVCGNTEPVKPPIANLSELRNRLKKLTKPRGSKASLAKALGVKPPRISEWLSTREPSGDIAIKLLRWVEERERQK